METIKALSKLPGRFASFLSFPLIIMCYYRRVRNIYKKSVRLTSFALFVSDQFYEQMWPWRNNGRIYYPRGTCSNQKVMIARGRVPPIRLTANHRVAIRHVGSIINFPNNTLHTSTKPARNVAGNVRPPHRL
ncbi:hypothetical protein CVT26_000553 [Gymnopilus dilepis]|uniref:Uncharacterized protein n=1 Tax=Gymnopilus dilepis TaxID=231916 RepID=A0A409VH60_9AGAR|nr:hypothetical protein CVT26_000553 [Gymnopilus dilepis]